jgi:hypothetical protein
LPSHDAQLALAPSLLLSRGMSDFAYAQASHDTHSTATTEHHATAAAHDDHEPHPATHAPGGGKIDTQLISSMYGLDDGGAANDKKKGRKHAPMTMSLAGPVVRALRPGDTLFDDVVGRFNDETADFLQQERAADTKFADTQRLLGAMGNASGSARDVAEVGAHTSRDAWSDADAMQKTKLTMANFQTQIDGLNMTIAQAQGAFAAARKQFQSVQMNTKARELDAKVAEMEKEADTIGGLLSDALSIAVNPGAWVEKAEKMVEKLGDKVQEMLVTDLVEDAMGVDDVKEEAEEAHKQSDELGLAAARQQMSSGWRRRGSR